jgi:subtilase family serine protease
MQNRHAVVAAVLSLTLLLTGAGAASAQPMHFAMVCVPGNSTDAGCDSDVDTDANGVALQTALPAGYGPADLASAYALPGGTAGSGQTVAIVDAFDDPSAESDLGVYRSTYGLSACTTANGCFRKVNEDGASSPLPKANGGWSEEISLDLDMVSAVCPNCHILLVEGRSANFRDLGVAENSAVALGANEVSNSYGGSENGKEQTLDASYYNHPGTVITVSSGDAGYGAQYPAASPDVTAVGGTSLTAATSTTRGWTETAWSGAGSGCSAVEPKPSWQTDTGCANRSVADISAVADPNTPVAVYDSFQYHKYAGWLRFGGTSVASPLVAADYALAGNGAAFMRAVTAAYAAPAGSLNDVTSGSNGSCGGSYLCTAGPGYDGPTGLGTPNGVGAL